MTNMGPKMRYEKSYSLSTEYVYTIWRSEFFAINYKVHVIVVCLFLYFAVFLKTDRYVGDRKVVYVL